MNRNTEYYDILGINKNSTENEIKKAYRKKAMIYHPDKSQGNEEQFKKISEAYETLSNKEKRKKYDMFGKNGVNKKNINPTNIFEQMFRRNSFNFSKKNITPDIHCNIKVKLTDIYLGNQIDIEYYRDDICIKCNGIGSINGKSYKCLKCKGIGFNTVTIQLGPNIIQQSQSKCNDCNGTGETINDEDKCKTCFGKKFQKNKNIFKFKLPKGIPNNFKLTIQNQGNQTINKNRSNVILTMLCINEERYIRENNNLIMKINIDLFEGLCGFEKYFEHINGEKYWFSFNHLEQIKHETSKIIKGMGMPIFNQNNKFGDLIIKFNIEYPKSEHVYNNLKKFEEILKFKDNKIINKNYKKIILHNK